MVQVHRACNQEWCQMNKCNLAHMAAVTDLAQRKPCTDQDSCHSENRSPIPPKSHIPHTLWLIGNNNTFSLWKNSSPLLYLCLLILEQILFVCWIICWIIFFCSKWISLKSIHSGHYLESTSIYCLKQYGSYQQKHLSVFIYRNDLLDNCQICCIAFVITKNY